MYFGGSIALIALGAILTFAVKAQPAGIDLVVVGYICMGAGALGIVLAFIANSQRTRRAGGDELPPR